jgi:hypothetical protein
MRKAADALAAAGHNVHVLWAYGTEWADVHDRVICANAKWSSEQIGGNPVDDRLSYQFSRIVRKAHELLGNWEKSICRAMPAYIQRAVNWQPDLVIGHNPGALAPLIAIQKRMGIPALFDAEDYHRGESYVVRAGIERQTAELEMKYMPQLTAMTTASPLISEAYSVLFPYLAITTVNNAFSRSMQPHAPIPVQLGSPLRIVWFSQVVGFDRGLQEFLDGMRIVAEVPIHLTLIGLSDAVKNASFQKLLGSTLHALHFVEPLPEPQLLARLADNELGLALEFPTPKNRDICRTNKLFTYPLAGCYMLASKTASQIQFLEEFPVTGQIIDLHQPETISVALQWAFDNRDALLKKRQATWQLAKTRLNWEEESKPLVEVVENIFSG